MKKVLFFTLFLGIFILAGCKQNFNVSQPLANTNFSPADQALPLAPQDIFEWWSKQNYFGQRFRFQGCFEPHKCSQLSELCVIDRADIKLGCTKQVCDLDHLDNCCDCIKMGTKCPLVDLQQVAKEKLSEIRKTAEIKYNIEVVGTVVAGSRMRPIQIEATDLKILGECPSQK